MQHLVASGKAIKIVFGVLAHFVDVCIAYIKENDASVGQFSCFDDGAWVAVRDVQVVASAVGVVKTGHQCIDGSTRRCSLVSLDGVANTDNILL